MYKKISIAIGLCLIASILVIVMLSLISKGDNFGNYGFIRRFPPHFLKSHKILDIKYNSYYVAGANKHQIYLGNITVPSHLLITDYSLTDTSSVRLKIHDEDSIARGALELKIDSPHVYMRASVNYSLLHGNLTTRKMSVNRFNNFPYIFSFAPVSPSSYALVTYDSGTQQKILSKVSVNPFGVKHKRDILEKQLDGMFCLDGMLLYDDELARFVYVYYYRNTFIYMDSSLNVIYKGKTIDTTTTAKIKPNKYASNGSTTFTMSAPPLLVNKKSSVFADWLYVHSVLIADNENKQTFQKYSVIDVYSLKDRRYYYSFYLPHIQGKKLSSFKVHDKTLIAIHDHYLATYQLNLP